MASLEGGTRAVVERRIGAEVVRSCSPEVVGERRRGIGRVVERSRDFGVVGVGSLEVDRREGIAAVDEVAVGRRRSSCQRRRGRCSRFG